jgi:hypothetical protein
VHRVGLALPDPVERLVHLIGRQGQVHQHGQLAVRQRLQCLLNRGAHGLVRFQQDRVAGHGDALLVTATAAAPGRQEQPMRRTGQDGRAARAPHPRHVRWILHILGLPLAGWPAKGRSRPAGSRSTAPQPTASHRPDWVQWCADRAGLPAALAAPALEAARAEAANSVTDDHGPGGEDGDGAAFRRKEL